MFPPAKPLDREEENNTQVVSCSELTQISPLPEYPPDLKLFKQPEDEGTTLSLSPAPDNRVDLLPHSKDLGCNKPLQSWNWTHPVLASVCLGKSMSEAERRSCQEQKVVTSVKG